MNTPPPGDSCTPERLAWLNQQLASLADGCPHTRTNPGSCPLHEVRKLPAPEISKWLDGLVLEEKEYLMLYHQCCLVIRWETAPPSVRPRERRAHRRRST